MTCVAEELGLDSTASPRLLENYTYTTWGKNTGNHSSRVDGGGSFDNPIRYAGEYLDEETGNIYLRNRYYSPFYGRFISEDTHWNIGNMVYGDKEYAAGEMKVPDFSAIRQSTNLHSYCMNDPVNMLDRTGNIAIAASAALAALGYAIVYTAGVAAVTALAWLTAEQIKQAYDNAGYTAGTAASYNYNWDIDDNRKHHVKNGSGASRDNHGPIWKKLGVDPGDPDFWNKLVPFLKIVMDKGEKIKIKLPQGNGIDLDGLKVVYKFIEQGVEVTLKFVINQDGSLNFSDAYGRFL